MGRDGVGYPRVDGFEEFGEYNFQDEQPHESGGASDDIENITGRLGSVELTPAFGSLACDNPWFCPYHYESDQSRSVQNSDDFVVGKCFGTLPKGTIPWLFTDI